MLGQAIDEGFVAPTLTALGFEPAPAAGDGGAVWRVRVPDLRVDVSREEDLIEEIARHHGYDEIPGHLPGHDAAPRRRPVRGGRATAPCGGC